MEATINVTTTEILSRKVESHRENKDREEESKLPEGESSSVLGWIGTCMDWNCWDIAIGYPFIFKFPFLFLILFWLLKWNSLLTLPPPCFFIITRISSWIVFEDTVSTLLILLFFGKGNMPHCLSSFIVIPLFSVFPPTWIKNLTEFW